MGYRKKEVIFRIFQMNNFVYKSNKVINVHKRFFLKNKLIKLGDQWECSYVGLNMWRRNNLQQNFRGNYSFRSLRLTWYLLWVKMIVSNDELLQWKRKQLNFAIFFLDFINTSLGTWDGCCREKPPWNFGFFTSTSYSGWSSIL